MKPLGLREKPQVMEQVGLKLHALTARPQKKSSVKPQPLVQVNVVPDGMKLHLPHPEGLLPLEESHQVPHPRVPLPLEEQRPL